MKLRKLILTLGVAGLLAPAALPAADAAKPKARTYCDRVSGTIIQPSAKNGCKTTVQPFRSYSAEDLARTGEMDINEALRKVDTIFR